MDDAQYINYGDLKIEYKAFLSTLTDKVIKYVNNKDWSPKRKNEFMNAYRDILNRGIVGASDKTGEWKIEVNGNDLYLDLKSQLLQEMYKRAAFFIKQEMSRMPTINEKNDESVIKKDNEEIGIPVFGNEQFLSELKKSIASDRFGTFDFDISRWNNLDKERNETGERLRSKRAEVLKNHLQKFNKLLTKGKYNFTESPFGSYENFKTRLNNAILALSTPDISDDEEALNRIGLKESDWFDTGLKDTFINDYGKEMTYGQKALLDEALRKLAEEKAKQEAEDRFKKQKEEAAKALLNVSKYKTFYSHKVTDKVFKIPDFNNINSVGELADLIRRDFSNIKTNDEFKKHINKILGAYIILNNDNRLKIVHNDIWKYLQDKKSAKNIYPFKNRRLSDFKMLEGIDNIILDIKNNQIWFLDENKIKPLDSILRYRKLLDEYRKKYMYMISPSTGLVYYT